MREPDDGISEEYRIPRLFILNRYIAESGESTGAKDGYDLRMRKTKRLLLIALLAVVGVAKAVETTDKVVISELTLAPGGEYGFFTVNLQGSTVYTGYEVHFDLPEGLEVYYSDGVPVVYMAYDDLSLDGNDIYPFTKNMMTQKKTYTHTLSSNFINNELIVACISTESKNLTATSGALFHVFVQATPYLKPGNVEIKVKDVVLVENVAQGDGTFVATSHTPADYVSTSVKAGATSTLALKVSADNKFGTCILPFDYDLPADGSLEAYACENVTDDAFLLTRANKIEAYTPYILYSENGFSATVSGEVDANNYPMDGIAKSGYLVGVLAQRQLTKEVEYVMQNQGKGAMFYRINPEFPFTLTAGKCYVELPENTNVASYRIGGTTSVDNALLTGRNEDAVIYNVMGQREDHMLSGRIYIVDGHKVIAK